MQQKDNFRTRKDDGDSLGDKDKKQKISKDPAPSKADRESENTPPENEIYVDLEPEELHPDDEPLDVNDESK